jgi:hypothetical protein
MRSDSTTNSFPPGQAPGQEPPAATPEKNRPHGPAGEQERSGQAQKARALRERMDFFDLNNRLAEMKHGLIRKMEATMGEIFLEISKLYEETGIRADVYQELARLRAENAAMEQRHLEDLASLHAMRARLKESRKDNRNPLLRRISAK